MILEAQLPPSPQHFLIFILTDTLLLSQSWKQWLMQKTPVYCLTQIIRESYLLSNMMRHDIWIHALFMDEMNPKDYLELSFNPNKLRYLAPDSRSIYFLLHNSIQRYYLRKNRERRSRRQKPLPGIHVNTFNMPQSFHTDLLLTSPHPMSSFSPFPIHPAPKLGNKILVDLRKKRDTPMIIPKYHVQWNPIWQFLTLYLNHP